MLMPDFRLPPGSRSELCSSGLLCCIITLKSAVLGIESSVNNKIKVTYIKITYLVLTISVEGTHAKIEHFPKRNPAFWACLLFIR